MTMNVAILGCGPAGLLAAHAAAQAGCHVRIYSIKKPSEIGGAQYLHEHIPGLTREQPDAVCAVIKTGTPEVYAETVYGNPNAPTSWDLYDEGEVGIWNMRQVYSRAWTMYSHCIHPMDITPWSVNDLVADHDLVVSAVPLPVLVPDGVYVKQDVWIEYYESDSKMDRNINLVAWNGTEADPYYRYSSLFGWKSYEYGHRPGGIYVRRIQKPLRSEGTTDAFPDVLRVGRYGKWMKGVLIHDAYHDTKEHLEKM